MTESVCRPNEDLYGWFPYVSLVCRVLARRFPKISAEDIEDLAQDAVLDASCSYDPEQGTSPKTWVINKALYKAQEFLRRRKHEVRLDDCTCNKALSYEVSFTSSSDMPNPDIERIKEMVQQLPPRQAEVFRLYFYAGESYPNIAEQLQISESAVRSNVSHALKKLRKWLE